MAMIVTKSPKGPKAPLFNTTLPFPHGTSFNKDRDPESPLVC